MGSGYDIVSLEITENDRITNGVSGDILSRTWAVTVMLIVDGESPAATLADIEQRLM